MSQSHSSKPSSHNTKLGYIIWLIVSVLYGYQYIVRIFPAVAMDGIIQKFAITADQFGYFAGIYYIGYSIGHIPFSIMLAKTGTKQVLVLAMATLIVGILPSILSPLWTLNVIGRFLVGFGSSGFILGGMKMIRIAFGIGFGRMTGLMVTVGLLIASVSNQASAAILKVKSLDYLSIVFIVTAGVLGALILVFMPDQKQIKKSFGIAEDDDRESPAVDASDDHQPVRERSKRQHHTILSDVRDVVLNFRIVSISIIGGLMLGVLEGFSDAWVIPFLENVYLMSREQAALGGSAIFVGLCIGFPLLGYIVELLSGRLSHLGLLVICAAGMLAMFLAVMFKVFDYSFAIYDCTINIVHIILLILGVLCGYQISVVSDAADQVSPRLFAMATAFANMVMMSFGSFFHAVIGNIIVISNQGQDGYSVDALIKGCMVVPITLLLAMVWLVLLWFFGRMKHRFKS